VRGEIVAVVLTRIRDGRSRFVFLAGATGICLLREVQTTFSMSIRKLFGLSSWRVKLSTHPHLAQKLRMTGARPPHALCLLGAIKDNFFLTFIYKACITGRDVYGYFLRIYFKKFLMNESRSNISNLHKQTRIAIKPKLK
jgi:hypothetical protein